ncbi:TVP38/TMEM64 family protein [Shimazuella kribbensis]|uniref:TVP38/TMEM64 family protein n=1 Tax=Shimazuella kribbensis TaxID=139808 RepID=UPI00042043D2|nr:TVP38/TMEM64 family protein [Shimazuella kribbensis]
MQHQVESFLYTYREFAEVISILLNIVISITGFVPSFFLTVLNVKLFGFSGGLHVSIIGESLGALVAFWLYRLGARKLVQKKTSDHPKIQRLLYIKGKEAFFLILSLRFVPFIPSSLVTLFAALGSVSWIVFAIASTIGKIPALWMEVYAVNEVLNGSLLMKVLLSLFGIVICFYIWKSKKQSEQSLGEDIFYMKTPNK